jgi:hypothetical protein
MINWEDQKYLKNLFDIDGVAFDTYRKLPEKLRFTYLTKFKKDKITLDEFDSFCSSYSTSFTNELKSNCLSLFDIKCKIPYYVNKDRFIQARENDIEFTRDLKLKLLLCQ